jgi:hypothetical protein
MRTPRHPSRQAQATSSLRLAFVLAAAGAFAPAAPAQDGGPALPPPASAASEAGAASPDRSPDRSSDRSAIEAVSKQRLARILAAFAARSLRKDELAVADIDLSTRLAQRAVELNPDDVWAWRILLGAISLGDPADAANDALRSTAIERIVRLDPNDEVMRLRRIIDVIAKAPTAEERFAKYEFFLAPEQRAAVGAAVAARLSRDYALLLRRTGDIAGFERRLADAAALDPSYPEAAALAAGYFRFATEDEAKQAELLLAALVANPLDPLPMRSFATTMLDRGAYRTAARFLGIAADLSRTEFPILAFDELLGDLALATWAAGRGREAEDLLRRRQTRMHEYARDQMARQDPSLLGNPELLRQQRFAIPSAQMAVRTAILRDVGDAATIANVVDGAFFSFDAEVEDLRKRLEGDPTLSESVASALLEAAFYAYWLGENAAKGDEYVAKADATIPLNEGAKARFAAWSALRSADPSTALPLFEAIEGNDTTVRLGRALASIAGGKPRDGARILLEIAQATPGTLIGIDARARLQRLLGTTLPQSELAAKLEAVGDSLPTSFDRLFVDGARPLTFRIRLGDIRRELLGPLPVQLEITNNTPLPLAIDALGPIRELVAMQATVNVAGRATSFDVPPMMIPIDRALSIPSRSTLVVPVDLAYTEIGVSTVQFVQQGYTVAIRGLLNWETSMGGFRAGPFGDNASADLLRVDGVRLSDEWVAAAMERARAPRAPSDLDDLLVLVHAATRAETKPETATEMQRTLFEGLWRDLPGILQSLDPYSLAWALFVFPDVAKGLEPALAAVQPSTDPTVRLSYLVRRVAGSGDPAIEAALQSGDERIAAYARLVKEMLLHDEEVTRRDFALGTSGGRAGGAETPPNAEPDAQPDSQPETPTEAPPDPSNPPQQPRP